MDSSSNRIHQMLAIKDFRLDDRWFMNLTPSYLAATMKRET